MPLTLLAVAQVPLECHPEEGILRGGLPEKDLGV